MKQQQSNFYKRIEGQTTKGKIGSKQDNRMNGQPDSNIPNPVPSMHGQSDSNIPNPVPSMHDSLIQLYLTQSQACTTA